jgi:hypothetical protein
MLALCSFIIMISVMADLRVGLEGTPLAFLAESLMAFE